MKKLILLIFFVFGIFSNQLNAKSINFILYKLKYSFANLNLHLKTEDSLSINKKINPSDSLVPEYNTYYGILHNHTSISDGTGTASQAYTYPRNNAGLDFFSLADHSGGISSTEWTTTKNAANAANVDGSFVAFWGFEWTSGGKFGHVAVIGTEDYCTTSGATNTFSGLCTWLNSRNGVAFFNHPGREDDINTEFSHFTTSPSDKFVGMELWNKSDAFSEYFYNDGYNTGDGELS
ncbi:MAG: hypothetical protein WCK02_09810 [Bacteroidota bacterium]